MKNWMFILSDIGSLIISVFILNAFFSIFGEQRWAQKWIKWIFSVAFVSLGGIVNYFNQIQLLYVLAMLLLVSLYSVLYKMKFWRRTFAVLFIYIIFIFSESFVFLLISAVSSFTIEQLRENILAYVLAAIVIKIFVYVIIRVVASKASCKSNHIPKVIIAAFIVLPLTTFAILFYAFEYAYTSSDRSTQIALFVLSMLLIASNMIVFLIFDYISKTKDKEKTVEIKAKQLGYERQYYKDLYEKQSQSDKITHDLKNKFYAIQALINQDVERAKIEIDAMANVLSQVKRLRITGNMGIDALLNHKVSQAKELGIEVDIISCIGSVDSYDMIDLCVILGNLLDNSIEACSNLDSGIRRYINIRLKQELHYLKIVVENACSNIVDTSKTVKKDREHHGFGITNIKEVVSKYNGYFDVVSTETTFIATVLLEEIQY